MQILKARSHKYIKKVPKKSGYGYNYFYARDFRSPFRSLLAFFGIERKTVSDDYRQYRIREDFGVDQKTFAQHVLHYFLNKNKWDSVFSGKKREKSGGAQKKDSSSKRTSDAKKEVAKKTTQSQTYSRALMRKIYTIYNKDEAQEHENRSRAMLGNENAKGNKGGDGGKGYTAKLRDEFSENTKKYLNTDFTNKSTGIKARFSVKSQKEIRGNLSNSKANGFTVAEHFEVANQIKELFENSTLEKEHEDTKYGDKNIRIERFLSGEIALKSGKKAMVCITVKHTVDSGGRSIYSIEAMDIKNALEKTRAKGQDHKGDLPSNSTIAQDGDSVKKNSKISTKPQTDAQMKAEKGNTQKAREKAGLPKRELFVCESMGRRAVRSLLDRF